MDTHYKNCAHLPPSDPPSESSDDDSDAVHVNQTSDDIPLIGLLLYLETQVIN
jgi:hypothetical protein